MAAFALPTFFLGAYSLACSDTELVPRLCVGRGLGPLEGGPVVAAELVAAELVAKPPLAVPDVRATRGPRTLDIGSPNPGLESEVLLVRGFSSSGITAGGVVLIAGTVCSTGDGDLAAVGGETTVLPSSLVTLSNSTNVGRGGGL